MADCKPSNTGGPCCADYKAQQDKRIQCLCQQLKNYERQVDSIQEELDRVRSRYSTCCRELEDMKRKLNQRDDAIACYESQIEEIRFDLKEKEKLSQKTIEMLQEKVCCFHEQAQQRESALQLCKTEVKSHLTTMEELKNNFSCEIAQRDSCIKQLKDDLRRVYDQLKEKTEENSKLERQILDMKSDLHQSCAQMKEWDTRMQCLQEKIQQLETQLCRDKEDHCKELEDCDRRYNQACGDVQTTQNEVRKLKRHLQEQDELLHSMTSERDSIARELANEKEEANSFRDRSLSLENDNKEICRLLQQKVKRIKELEQALCVKEEEVEQCQCCVDELNARIRKMNTSNACGGNDDDIRNKLAACQNRLKTVEKELEETLKKLDWAVKEMECLAMEAKRLTCELEEAKKEICEKNAHIEDLQQAIEHAEHDMESRMRRADEQLQKYEKEIKEKMRMLVDCDEKCMRLQHCLSDKELEMEQKEQKLCRCINEITSLQCKIKELEECRDQLQHSCKEQLCNLAELSQEFSCLKEQHGTCTAEFTECKKGFTSVQREMDKTRKEAEDLRQQLWQKETELSSLTEERNCMVAKATSLQCRLETETIQLTKQMSDLRHRLESELEQLKTVQVQLEDTNASLQQKVTSGQRQLAQMEKSFCQKVDSLTRENNMLQTKVGDKDDQLQAAKDCLTLKESEIMRLKLRICSLDRCNNSCNNNYLVNQEATSEDKNESCSCCGRGCGMCDSSISSNPKRDDGDYRKRPVSRDSECSSREERDWKSDGYWGKYCEQCDS